MEKVEMIKKIQELVCLSEQSGMMGNEPYESLSSKKRWQEMGERVKKLENEIIDALCQHKWKCYCGKIFECEICKIRRLSKEDLCPTT